ncbi:DUF1381 domain-containing protein [Staphylococcus aureus]|uniref:DUF1381 domain-containing protein n=1 Tax=Staphylococcus aureus TaxID=1280 RepID=UPI0013A705BD|nr:DUF1381 domain-containing protein [Staphylococcus aureus]NDR33014.1 DUF1381 domain-containing protein [Staphylococcus aureus]HDZ8686840.1 DUF1381 domain-containing protein [Staphylococcus aureus]HED8493699.1 DUF1381 domain-containing protein [Staphylococcus aureus]
MKQYLIKHITHDTSETFIDIVEAKDNETFTLVTAMSKEEAKEKYEVQVKRDAVIKVSQLFKNIRECGK